MNKMKLTDQSITCFAKREKGCSVRATKKCPKNCVFYKPAGCRDWVRVERGCEVWLIPPEEYFAERAEKR